MRTRAEALRQTKEHMARNPVYRLSSIYRSPATPKKKKTGPSTPTKPARRYVFSKTGQRVFTPRKPVFLAKKSPRKPKPKPRDIEFVPPAIDIDPNDPLSNVKSFIDRILPGVPLPRYLENQMRKSLVLKNRISSNIGKRERFLAQRKQRVAEEEAKLSQVANIYKRDYEKYLDMVMIGKSWSGMEP